MPTAVQSNITTRRRDVFAIAAGALLAGGGLAGVNAAMPPVQDQDALLLSYHAELVAAVADVSNSEVSDAPPLGSPYDDLEEWIDASGDRLSQACWAIVKAPPAQTPEGRALKAAAAMHEYRYAFDNGWPGDGEEMAWLFLSEIAGDVYVLVSVHESVRQSRIPARA